MVTVILKKVDNGQDRGLRVNKFEAKRIADTYTGMGYNVILIYGGF